MSEYDGADSAYHTDLFYTSTTDEYGDLLSEYDGADNAYHTYDALGSTDALLNDAEAATDRYTYRAFGQLEFQSGTSDSPFTFVGQQNYYKDEELDLYFAAARYLDPTTGQWTSKDPIGIEAEDPNYYRYVGNNPTNKIDPSGTEWWEWYNPLIFSKDVYDVFFAPLPPPKQAAPPPVVQPPPVVAPTVPPAEAACPNCPPPQTNFMKKEAVAQTPEEQRAIAKEIERITNSRYAGGGALQSDRAIREAETLRTPLVMADAIMTNPRYWSQVGEGLQGYFYDAPQAILGGLWHMATHPGETLYALGTAIRHPIKTVSALWEGLSEPFAKNDARGMARVIGEQMWSIPLGKALGEVMSKASQRVQQMIREGAEELSQAGNAARQAGQRAEQAVASKVKPLQGTREEILTQLDEFYGGAVVEGGKYIRTLSQATSKHWVSALRTAKGLVFLICSPVCTDYVALLKSFLDDASLPPEQIGAIKQSIKELDELAAKYPDAEVPQKELDAVVAKAKGIADKIDDKLDEIALAPGNVVTPGTPLGSGGNKNVFVVQGDETKAVGVLKPGKPATALDEEIALIKQLEAQGLPTVKIHGVVEVEGRPAIVMDRYAQGSKDVVRLQDGKVRIVGDSPLLNERSVADLQKIKDTMIKNNVKIDDLQFLIGPDGRVVVADPLKVVVGQAPSKNNLRMIDLLIDVAKKR